MLTFVDACVLARRALKAGNIAEMQRYVNASLSDYWNDNATLTEYFTSTLSNHLSVRQRREHHHGNAVTRSSADRHN